MSLRECGEGQGEKQPQRPQREVEPHLLLPISETVSCAVVTSVGGHLNGEKRCISSFQDSSEGLVKVATCEMVYKCL